VREDEERQANTSGLTPGFGRVGKLLEVRYVTVSGQAAEVTT